jgi:ABC-type multidrug transport system fused ATPase/permease subunit
MDCVAFGTILYFMVGLTNTVGNFLIFLAIIFSFSVLMSELLFVFSTVSKTKENVQVISACLVFFFILFGGFIIPPNVIPHYYTWIYWWNPMAWAYRALLVLEYRSSEYTQEEGDKILSFAGIVKPSGEPFGMEWVAYSVIYMALHTVLTMFLSALGLSYVRPSADNSFSEVPVENPEFSSASENNGSQDVRIAFKPVTLTVENICYDVKASTSSEQLRLLHDVNGAFKSGRMCALMGSSGAGKTTLMVSTTYASNFYSSVVARPHGVFPTPSPTIHPLGCYCHAKEHGYSQWGSSVERLSARGCILSTMFGLRRAV